MPLALREEAGGIVIALVSLELFGEGLGVLRYRISVPRGGGRRGFDGIPEPEMMLLTPSGDGLRWSPMGGGSGSSEAEGEVEIRDLPEAGGLEVRVERLVVQEWSTEAAEEEPVATYEGPWVFHLAF